MIYFRYLIDRDSNPQAGERKWIQLTNKYQWWLFEFLDEMPDINCDDIEYKVNEVIYLNPTPRTLGFAEAFKKDLTWMNLQQ